MLPQSGNPIGRTLPPLFSAKAGVDGRTPILPGPSCRFVGQFVHGNSFRSKPVYDYGGRPVRERVRFVFCRNDRLVFARDDYWPNTVKKTIVFSRPPRTEWSAGVSR